MYPLLEYLHQKIMDLMSLILMHFLLEIRKSFPFIPIITMHTHEIMNSNKHINFLWISSHSRIKGTDVADQTTNPNWIKNSKIDNKCWTTNYGTSKIARMISLSKNGAECKGNWGGNIFHDKSTEIAGWLFISPTFFFSWRTPYVLLFHFEINIPSTIWGNS